MDVKLGRQTSLAAVVHIGSRNDTWVDAGEDPLELGRVLTLGGDLGEVDVEEGILGQIWLSGGDDRVGEVGSELGVDETADRLGAGVPGDVALVNAREGDAGDALGMGGVADGADGAGEGHGEPDVGADVGAGDGELGLGAVPELRSDGLDAVLHGRDGEGVDPVEVGAGGVEAGGRAVGRTAVEVAGLCSGLGSLIEGA